MLDLFPEVTEAQLQRIGVRTLGQRLETEENQPVTERSIVNENENQVAHPENKVNGGNEEL